MHVDRMIHNSEWQLCAEVRIFLYVCNISFRLKQPG